MAPPTTPSSSMCASADTHMRGDGRGGGTPNSAPTRAPLMVMTINVAGLGDWKKRRAFFKWIKQKRADIILLTETHLTNERVERGWRMGWEGGGGSEGNRRSWWTHSTSAHTGGTAVLIRAGLQVDDVVVTREEGAEGRWIKVACTLHGSERWAFTAVYAPASARARVQWLRDTECCWAGVGGEHEGSDEEEREVVAGDFNCVEDITVDVFNRPAYKNEGGPRIAAALEHAGWSDAWRIQKRKPTMSGMTRWTKGERRPGGSRLDRIYVTQALRQRVVSALPVVCPFSDHNAVVARIHEGGQQKNAATKRFTVNAEVARSVEGRQLVTDAIVDTAVQFSRVTPTERWCKVKVAIRQALRELAIQRAQWSLQDYRELQAEVEALSRRDFLTADQHDEFETAKVRLRERELVKAHGAAMRARQRWSEEGERSTKYFLGLERARKGAPGELAVKGKGGETITGRAKVARAVRTVWGDIFTEPSTPHP